MSKLRISLWFTILVICSFCNKNFVSLGRHSWRCREDVLNNSRLSQTPIILATITTIILKEVILQLNHHYNKALLLTFMCIADVEENVKDFAILKHRRTCRFVMGLTEELIQPEQDIELETNDIEDLISTSSDPDLKPGVKLP